jgi:hypothetical protein
MRGTFANIRLRNQLAPAPRADGRRSARRERWRPSTTRRCGTASEACRSSCWRARSTVRVVAGLGGEGHAAARRQGGARRELRADPSQQPRQHGRPAAAVPRRGVVASLKLTGRERFDIIGMGESLTPSGGARAGHRVRRRRCELPAIAGSTPRRNWSRSATAASCRTCCGSWPGRRRSVDQPARAGARLTAHAG